MPEEHKSPSHSHGGHLAPTSVALGPALVAGLVTGIVVVMLNVAFAALIFSGEMSPYLDRGLGITLTSAVVLGVIVGMASSLPTVIATPQDTIAVVLAVIVTAVATTLMEDGHEEQVYPTVVAAIVVTSLVVGLFFLLLGRFHLGRLIRFVPYPVIGGFLAGTGWLLIKGSLQVMLDVHFKFGLIPKLGAPDLLIRWLPGALLGVLLFALARRYRRFYLTPAILLGAIPVFYVALALMGIPVDEAARRGWLLGPFSGGFHWPPMQPAAFTFVDWGLVFQQLGNMLVIMVLAAIGLLLNSTELELATRTDADLDRELRITGVSTMVTGVLGGMPGYTEGGLSLIAPRMGSRSRLVPLVSALLSALILATEIALIGYIPRMVLGGLLVFLGLGLFAEWVVEAWHELPHVDWALILLILGVIVVAGPLAGVAVGLVVAAVLFVVSYSRVNVVKHGLSGLTYRSNVDRTMKSERLLRDNGDLIYILKLQGFLFFGTANSLLTDIRARLDDPARRSPRYVVLDFQLVTGVDSSAVLSFTRLRQVTSARDITLIFTGLSDTVREQLGGAGYPLHDAPDQRVFSTLDYGVEWAEDAILAAEHTEGDTALPLIRQLAPMLPPNVPPASLMAYMERMEVQPGEYLVRQGDASDEMYLVEAGEVTVLLEHPGGDPIRLRTMGAGTLVGELGFFLATPRTASVVVEEPGTVYRLTNAALATMNEREPELAAAFNRLVATILADRVVNANHTIEALLQ